MSGLLTIPEVMERLKICRASTYNMIDRGVLPTVRLPGMRSVRVPEAAIEEIENSYLKGATASGVLDE